MKKLILFENYVWTYTSIFLIPSNNIHQRYEHITNTIKHNMHKFEGLSNRGDDFLRRHIHNQKFFPLITWWVGMCCRRGWGVGEGGTQRNHTHLVKLIRCSQNYGYLCWGDKHNLYPYQCPLTKAKELKFSNGILYQSNKNITFVDCLHSELHYIHSGICESFADNLEPFIVTLP